MAGFEAGWLRCRLLLRGLRLRLPVAKPPRQRRSLNLSTPIVLRLPLRRKKNSPSEQLPEKPETAGESHAETAPFAIAALPRPDNFGEDYVPRLLLTVPPAARTPVVFAVLPGKAIHGRYVGILSLFIDEHGTVQRIEADAASLPETLEQAAREAFMAAQFAPGEIDGIAVKSRVRVEVIFDDAPLSER